MSTAIMDRRGAGQAFLGAILVLHLGLSLAYSVAVPLAEAPDELSHYDYCRIVAKEWRLPAGTEAGEAFQPPLYYLLGAALTWPLPMDLEFARSNPAFHLTDPQASKNLFIHGRAEAFPYGGSSLAFHLLRAFSALLSTCTVWAVYRGLLTLTGGDRVAALGGAGFLAFVPEFAFLGGTVQNDNLTALCAALLLWRLLLVLQGQDTWREWALVGVLLGLSLLTKLSLLAFVPFAVLVAAYRAWSARA
ncbi:MAG: glycosyltransferase family 39 protein, partial [Anaerolineae bacterium]